MMPRFLVDYWCGERGNYGMWINLLSNANLGGGSCDHKLLS